MTNAKSGRTGARKPADVPGRLESKLRSGGFGVTFELSPPRGASLAALRRRARQLHDVVDAVNVTDGQSATARMASWAGCIAVMQEDVEPVMQLVCRDRNRIALQADLLGAAGLGIPNVLLLTGDHMRFGDHPDAKGVFDMDSIQLIWTARTMQEKGELLSGLPLSPAPHWFLGAVENPFAAPQRFRAERLGKKVAAGARFFQTQYVFDVPAFARFIGQVRDLGFAERCYILAGVGPIRSRRALTFLRDEISGIHIPADLQKRLLAVPEDRMEHEGIEAFVETLQALREMKGVSGVHILAAGMEEQLPAVLRRAGIPTRIETERASATLATAAGERGGHAD